MTVACVEDGWGVGWGNTPWGGADDSVLRVVGAVAVAENVVRVEFNVPPFFSGTLELGDASNAERWAIVVAKGSPDGIDGLAPHPVSPIIIVPALFAGADGRFLDVTIDRPFSPYPSRYVVSANNLLTLDGFSLDPCSSSLAFPATYKTLVPMTPAAAIPNADIANPMNLAAALDPLPNPFDPANLGTIVVGDLGDYQIDTGPVNFEKRCLRRLLFVKGTYVGDPNYGVSTPAQIKQLGRPATLIALAKEAEAQITLEPETAQVRARLERDPNNAGNYRFRVLVRSKAGIAFVIVAPLPSGISVSF